MGRLSSEPAMPSSRGGEGGKFLRLYAEVFDDEDRAEFRRCVETDGLAEAHRRVLRDFPEVYVGESVVSRALRVLRAVEWDASKISL